MSNRIQQYQPWTQKEILQLRASRRAGAGWAEIAAGLGRTPKACKRKLEKVGYVDGSPGLRSAPYPSDAPIVVASENIVAGAPEDDKNRVAYWRKQASELTRALNEARASKTAEEVLMEQVHELAPKSYQPPPFESQKVVPPESKTHASGQSAVLLFSDQHIGSVVKPEQTLNLGNYNFELFLRRLKRLERSIFSILSDHTNTAVPEIVIPMLGDALDGALAHSAEAGQENTMLEQFYSGGHAIAQFLRNLSTLAPLRIYGCVGNHPRWQNQKKMPTKNRASNFDQLLYLYIQALTRDITRIAWHLDWQPFATFEVQGYPFYCAHGDVLRGGDKALGLPAHAMGRMISTTTQLFTRAGRETPAYYCVGHLHRPISIPHAKGEIIVNGAFPGIDGYALSEFFNSAYPSQKFFLVHKNYGRSATYDLRLDLGDETPHGYELPDQFACK